MAGALSRDGLHAQRNGNEGQLVTSGEGDQMTVCPRACAALAIFVFATLASAQTQFYDPQSQPKHSTMFGVEWEPITDNEFALMARGLLVKNGASNTRGASFLFEQCFSGGMFDELNTQFGNEVRWVGG